MYFPVRQEHKPPLHGRLKLPFLIKRAYVQVTARLLQLQFFHTSWAFLRIFFVFEGIVFVRFLKIAEKMRGSPAVKSERADLGPRQWEKYGIPDACKYKMKEHVRK
jgi:hypothetical protein